MARRKTIADLIRAEIKLQKMSGYRLAQLTGMNEATAYRLINNQGGVQMETLDAVLDALGLVVVRADGTKPGSKRSS